MPATTGPARTCQRTARARSRLTDRETLAEVPLTVLSSLLRRTPKYEVMLPQIIAMAEAGSGTDLISRLLGIGAGLYGMWRSSHFLIHPGC